MIFNKSYIILFIEKIQKKSEKEAQNMRKAKTIAGVEKATTLINNNQAKRLALLSILRASTKHGNA